MKPWQEFEDAVAALLLSAGMDVQKSLLVSHQQVDVLATRRELGRSTVMAVECKAFKEKLDKDLVANTYVKYESLIETGLVDEVLLVSLSGLAPSAATYVSKKRFLRHLTFDELHASIIGFSRYLGHIEARFAESGLAEYLIPVRLSAADDSVRDADAQEYIFKWLAEVEAPPLALISSYGTGKSTLSLCIATQMVAKHKLDPAARIPILIDLGKVSDVQGLEGLLGKLMTNDNAVTNYSFPLFMELNRRGRFFVILDGFDEMKHGISWEAFMNNIEEIRRLLGPNSRLMICGRPSIFLDEAEHNEALQGRYKVGERWVRSSFFAGFREVSLQPLTREEIAAFLRNYLSYLTRVGHIRTGATDRIIQRMEEEGTGAFYDLASRPVQLHMLANVLPEWDQPLDRLSRTLLFDHFLEVILAREAKKSARLQLGSQPRRDFSRLLAWHMWMTTKRDYIRADEIPESIIAAAKINIHDARSAKRELIAGCCLEFKPPDLLRFAHRSLQEFLVGQEFAIRLKSQRVTIAFAESEATPEILEFIHGIIEGEAIEEYVPILLKHEGRLPQWWESQFLKDLTLVDRICELVRPGIKSPWPGIFMVYRSNSKHSWLSGQSAFRRLAAVGTRDYLNMAFHCLAMGFLSRRHSDDGSLLDEAFFDEIRRHAYTDICKGHKSAARLALATLLKEIAIYPNDRTRLELGTVRKSIVNSYLSSGWLSEFLKEQRLSDEFDFRPLAPCSSKLADSFRDLRDRIETERL